MAVDVAGDMISGIAAVGIYTAAVAAAPFTGGASIAVGVVAAAGSGALIKSGIKYADTIGTNRKYTLKNLGHDCATGAFSGALAPITGGLGGAVGKTVATKFGIQAVKTVGKEVAEEVVKGGVKNTLKTALINPAGYEYVGGTLLKRGTAMAAEMATDGALGGAIDTAFRTGYEQVESGEGLDWGVIGESALQGCIGGAIMSPIIGGGMKATGKAGHSLGSYFGFNKSSQLVPTEKISKNLTEATGVVSSVKINELASSGIKLKYGRDEFAGKLKEIVNHLPIEKQEEILSKFNIKLIYTADNSFQIKDIPTIPTGKIKDKTELSIKKEIQKFIKENEFVSGNTELDKFLNDFTKNVPEFFYTIGKKQHETHEFTVDVHTLSVLKKSIENPEYSKLADEDKVVLNFAIMLHDLTKEFVDVKTPDRNHAWHSADKAIEILDRFNLDDNLKTRIVKLVKNHEFFASYNSSYQRYTRVKQISDSEVAAGLRASDISTETSELNHNIQQIVQEVKNSKDFNLLKILTEADLQSVNSKVYTDEWNNIVTTNNGFHQRVTNTDSDDAFHSYMKEAFSLIDKEFEKNKGVIEDDFVYPSSVKKLSKELFGDEDVINNRCITNVNNSFGVRKQDLDFFVEQVNKLKKAGFKPDEIARDSYYLIKYNDGVGKTINYEETARYIDFYLKNLDIIKEHDFRLDNWQLRSSEALENAVNVIKQKKEMTTTFKKYKLEDSEIERLQRLLYYNEDGQNDKFCSEAYEQMIKLLETKEYKVEDIASLIFNSYTDATHRLNYHNSSLSYAKFDKTYLDTVLKFTKEPFKESLNVAIQDAKLCYLNVSKEKGWTLIPEFESAINEFNKLGIKDKSFIQGLFDFEYKDKHTSDFQILSVKKNEYLYNKALKYAKLGFEGQNLLKLIKTSEIINGKQMYNEAITDEIAKLWQKGIDDRYSNISDSFWYRPEGGSIDDLKFNWQNLKFIKEMLETGISPKDLDDIISTSRSYDTYAKKFAPESMIENSNLSQAQIRGLIRYLKETGNNVKYIEESFIEYNVPDEILTKIRMTPVGSIPEYSKPFAYVNETKLTQAIEYTKRGIEPSTIKHLTQDVNLFKELQKETDLSFIKTKNDAALVSKFWKFKDKKSINELSKEERLNLIVDLMRNKTLFENNNVSEKIPILPKTSDEYAKMMNDLSGSFGLNKPAFSPSHNLQLEKNATTLVEKLKKASFTDITKDSEVNNLINNIVALLPELNNKNLFVSVEALQKVVKNADFEKLSEADKKIMIFSTLLHRIDSKSNNAFDSALDSYVIAKRIGFDDVDARKIYTIVKNSQLIDTFSKNTKKEIENHERSYIIIKSDEIQQQFDLTAFELKDYNNFAMARMLYSTYDDHISINLLKEYAPNLYNEVLKISKQSNISTKEAIDIVKNNPLHKDQIELVKIQGREKYGLTRNIDNMLQKTIQDMKSQDVLLPQTNLKNFMQSQSPEWIKAHKRQVNGRNIVIINSDEINDFYCLAHTTQAYGILGKADVTTNLSNFDAFAMFCDNKTVCNSYVGNGRVAVVGPVGVLVLSDNTSQYLARGTDISSVAKDIPTMINEYISQKSKIIQTGHYQNKFTKKFDRAYFASMIKEEFSQGYRKLLDRKLQLEEQLANSQQYPNLNVNAIKNEIDKIEKEMLPIDIMYAQKIDNLIKKANGKPIDIDFIRQNDTELGKAYDNVLSYINTEHRGDDGLMRTEYHNEVLASNLTLQGLYVTDEKHLMELTDDYLRKAETDNLPVVIIK